MGHSKEETTLKFDAQLDRGSMEVVAGTLDGVLTTPVQNEIDAHLTLEGISGSGVAAERGKL